MEEFKIECEEYMKDLGYSLHAHSGDKSHLFFSKINFETPDYFPSIEIFISESGEKRMKLSDCASYKFALHLTSGEIQFKHPDLEKYIEVFHYYSKLATKFPPF